MFGSVSHTLSRLVPILFRPLRRLFGPVHRRRTTFSEDPNNRLAPLGAPWTDERWFRADFPPREHNAIRVLHDGETYFEDLYEALCSARERVTIVGWCFTPLIPLLRGERTSESILANVLNEVSQHTDVYVLLWCGSPLLFAPTEHEMKTARNVLLKHAPRVHCALDHQAKFSHDHHQKAVTIDGRIAYIGGMDLTTYEGDRWDTNAHGLRLGPNWHDMMLRLEGEVVRDVQENFCQRWNAVTGDTLSPVDAPAPDPSWTAAAQIIRTVPKGFYPFAPDGKHGIFHALITAIRTAKRFIYLENQYIWAPEIIDALCEAISRKRDGPFRIVLLLPARAEEGRYDNDEHVEQLQSEDDGKGIFSVYALWTGGPGSGPTGFVYRPVYVHSKTSIVDDEWFAVGSANLNRRGLATDTEMDVQSNDAATAKALRVELWSKHLGLSEEEVARRDPIDLIDTAWPEAAKAMEDAVQSSTHPPQGNPRVYVPGRSPGSRVLDVVQGLTLEH
jgi:phosphatidylserine/phosphatidylglycerophosphate/cardiolipin synthase-like enzyme